MVLDVTLPISNKPHSSRTSPSPNQKECGRREALGTKVRVCRNREWVWEGAKTPRAWPAKEWAKDVNIVCEALCLLGGSLSTNHNVVQIFGELDLCFFHVSLLRQVFRVVLFRL